MEFLFFGKGWGTLIVIALVASAIGTIFPQETYIPSAIPASEHYQQEYGTLGKAVL